MFDESRNNNPFTDSVREEFCWACCLHGLLPESSVEVILGETPYSSFPSRGRYMKDQLVGECLSDSERMQTLVGELENMDGNVGAVAQALVEVGVSTPATVTLLTTDRTQTGSAPALPQ